MHKKPAILMLAMMALIVGFAITFIGVGSMSGKVIPLVVLSFSAFVFYFFYTFLIGPAMKAVRLKKNGIPGHARILSVKDTGMIINNNPLMKMEVELKDPFGTRYTTSVHSMVPRNNLQLYKPGMEVAVKIDPNKKESLIIDDTVSSSTSASVSAPGPVPGSEMLKEDKDAIIRTGRPAKAIVKQYTWLGNYGNGNDPFVELELEVIPPLYPRFDGKARGIIPEALVQKYQPGCEINVKLDLYDNNNIILDLN